MSARDDYSRAVREFKRLRDELAECQTVVAKVAEALKFPPTLFFQSTSVGALVHLSSVGGNEPTASAHDWKTADDLQQLVNDYETAKTRMRAAWNAIPDSDRDGLKPPDSV